MESIWLKDVSFQKRSPLHSDLKADVVIIGAGITGLLTAYLLKEKGIRAVILEADRICGGQTKGTTAKITSQHHLIYDRLIRSYGEEMAGHYAAVNEWAIREYERIIAEKGISCDFVKCPANLYSCLEAEPLQKEAEAAKKVGIHAEFKTECELPFAVKGILEFQDQARFHPLKFLSEIAKEAEIYEETPVLKVEHHSPGNNFVITRNGIVSAGKVIFACHFPFVNVPGYYFARMYQERSYVIALENAMELRGCYLGIDRDGYSFRQEGEFLLLGGGSHRTGDNRQGGKYQMLRDEAGKLWPKCREAAHWSAQDCMTLDGIPYIGPFDKKADDWYVATGFGKWGMTSAMAGAGILTAALEGKERKEADIFSPRRKISGMAVKEFAVNGGVTAGNLAKQLLSVKRTVTGEADGSPFEVSVKCPHLGCKLSWNPDERTWECPCHGSRFHSTGELADGPAQKGIRV